jgi:hypothetical protein
VRDGLQPGTQKASPLKASVHITSTVTARQTAVMRPCPSRAITSELLQLAARPSLLGCVHSKAVTWTCKGLLQVTLHEEAIT